MLQRRVAKPLLQLPVGSGRSSNHCAARVARATSRSRSLAPTSRSIVSSSSTLSCSKSTRGSVPSATGSNALSFSSDTDIRRSHV
eukprot:scaffold57950_cov30-Tisochrysis_lutea.AAC.6